MVQEDDCVLPKSSDAPGGGANSFACQLRALGQALEKFGLSAFDLEIRSGTYLVIAKETPAGHGEPPAPASPRRGAGGGLAQS